MSKNNLVNLQLVDEQIVANVKSMSESKGLKMIVDSGEPLYIVSEKYLKKYIEEKAVIE